MRKLWRTVRFLVGLSFRADPVRTTLILALTPVQSGVGALTGLWLKFIADGALNGEAQTVLWASVALAGSVGAIYLFNVILSKMRIGLEDRTGLMLDKHLMELTSGVVGIEHHERPEYLDRVHQLKNRRWLLRRSISSVIQAVGVTSRTVGMVALLATVDPILLLLPLFAIPTVVVGFRAEALAERVREKTAEPGRLSWRLFGHMTSPRTGAEIRIFGLGDELLARYRRLWHHNHEAWSRAELQASVWNAAAWTLFGIGFVGAIGVAVAGAASGSSTPGDVLLTVNVAGQVNGSVTGIVRQIQVMLQQLRSAEHYFWLAGYVDETKGADVGSSVPGRIGRGIAIESVSFRYPGTEINALTDVNLSIPAGTTLALVGENGAGKTTLVKLLCRFYEPTSGVITLDSEAIGSFDPEEWRSSISTGFQDFCRFEFLARENVGVGELRRIDNETSVRAALARAGGADVEADLPAGLATQLGKSWEDGVELSAGQWQKLALGRSMMRDHPLVMILDEPTASLDSPTEHALFERFAESARVGSSAGTITILVSHRFSTVRMADLIVVIDEGRIVEMGSHDELMREGKLYAELFTLQAQAYKN